MQLNNNKTICGVPCHWGNWKATRKYSNAEIGVMWRCNRRVKSDGDRCWQHKDEVEYPR